MEPDRLTKMHACILQLIGEGVVGVEPDGHVFLLNGAAERLTGLTEADAKGRPLLEVLPVEGKMAVETALKEVLAGRSSTALDTMLVAKDGHMTAAAIRVEALDGDGGQPQAACLLMRRSAVAPARSPEPGDASQPASIVTRDPLTGLMARDGAMQAIARALEHGEGFVSVFVMDRYQVLHRRFGASASDAVLVYYSMHLAQAINSADELFRWIGPSFTVVMRRKGSLDEVQREMSRVAAARLEKIIQLSSRTILVPVSATWKVFGLGNLGPADLEEFSRQVDSHVVLQLQRQVS